jgi:carbon monoxide dehydrogenase subunit G
VQTLSQKSLKKCTSQAFSDTLSNPRIAMELTGEVRINAPRESVWQALNDERCLMQCIPGCEAVEITSPTERHVRLLVKAGPVRARFVGNITLSDVVANSACVMNFEGSGGVAGMATGKSSVQLSDDDGGTLVRYTATASVGGKLGQIGARMLDAASKQMADQFFTRLSSILNAGPADAAPAAPAVPAALGLADLPQRLAAPAFHPQAPSPTSEGTRVLWFALGCLATGFGFMLAHFLH